MAASTHALQKFYLNPSIKELNLEGLSEEEILKITDVIKKEQDIVYKDGNVAIKGQKMEGQLCKFTNLVKGWQYRWFALDPENGSLSYYLSKDKARLRGSLLLGGAVVSPSDEDSTTFTINGASGEMFKLRDDVLGFSSLFHKSLMNVLSSDTEGVDAKDRQHWINLIRAVAEYHSASVESSPAVSIKSSKSPNLKRSSTLSTPKSSGANTPLVKSKSVNYSSQLKIATSPALSENPIKEELMNIKDALTSVSEYHSSTLEALQNGPQGCDFISPVDEQVLLLKATSQATVNILQQCYSIIQKQSIDLQGSAFSRKLPPGATIEWIEPQSNCFDRSSSLSSMESSDSAVDAVVAMDDFNCINQYVDDEILDEDALQDDHLEDMESHKSVIFHLLSQLKLGMDLTRVVLPTFALEKRSLLEMYADFLGHPDLFVRIADGETAERRMMSVVEFYLSTFHVGRKCGVAKKPYNPILGEHFHCSYKTKASITAANTTEVSPIEHTVNFLAEQVSHHPPISAFYAECPTKKISMNTHIWTKSKFYGMSVGVVNVGEGSIILSDLNEEYIITFPNAYCRSILTVPWMELGGRTFIRCPKTGYHASIMFHVKPFYGNKPNHVTFEVKNGVLDHNPVVCRGEGMWNGCMQFNFSDAPNEKKMFDITSLPIAKKYVRPPSKQEDFESRRLWQKVTSALYEGDLEAATKEKHKLEERQRREKKQRSATGVEWKSRFFAKHSDGWQFNSHFAQISRRKKSKSTSSIH